METTARDWHEGVISIPSLAFSPFAEGDGAWKGAITTHATSVANGSPSSCTVHAAGHACTGLLSPR